MAPKRKSAADEASAKKAAAEPDLGGELVNGKRIQALKAGSVGSGPVIYWMSRDQRVADNWALLHAAEVAKSTGAPVAVAFNLVRGGSRLTFHMQRGGTAAVGSPQHMGQLLKAGAPVCGLTHPCALELATPCLTHPQLPCQPKPGARVPGRRRPPLWLHAARPA
jgi:hypothetical protein